MPFAVNGGATAMPTESVVTTATVSPSSNVPLGPDDGAVNVTKTLGTPFAKESLTAARKRPGNLVFMGVRSPLSANATIKAGTEGKFVKRKFAGVGTPGLVALTT